MQRCIAFDCEQWQRCAGREKRLLKVICDAQGDVKSFGKTRLPYRFSDA
jgi:hypothetical protein